MWNFSIVFLVISPHLFYREMVNFIRTKVVFKIFVAFLPLFLVSEICPDFRNLSNLCYAGGRIEWCVEILFLLTIFGVMAWINAWNICDLVDLPRNFRIFVNFQRPWSNGLPGRRWLFVMKPAGTWNMGLQGKIPK